MIHVIVTDGGVMSIYKKLAEELGVEPAAIYAVVTVESGGSGFLSDGRPRILFEGHVMWRHLVAKKIDPVPYAEDYPNVVYESWVKVYYEGGTAEWDRLDIAKTIDEECAYMSASYGMFQILGQNYSSCGFDNVFDFVDSMKTEEGQLRAFVGFMEVNNLVRYVRDKDWAGFARRYNGSGYAANQYDIKMAKAYASYSGQ